MQRRVRSEDGGSGVELGRGARKEEIPRAG